MSQLEELARDLLAIPSVSGNEGRIADYVVARFAQKRGWELDRIGDTILAHHSGGNGPRVLLCGHLDTVPGSFEIGEDHEALWGLGACDMKGGLAVMLAMADAEFDCPLTLVFYPCEEVAFDRNGLHYLGSREQFLATHDYGVLLEPTDTHVELGCQGTLRLRVDISGSRAHTSRPWMGCNAIDRLWEVLSRVADFDRRTPRLAGVTFRESLSPVHVESFVANNVVPDRAQLWLNYRFAPDRTASQATQMLLDWLDPVLGPTDTCIVEDAADGALPMRDGFECLIDAAGGAQAKLGWTDVSFLTALGIPSVNYGPGDPLLAHSGRERLNKASLASALDTLLVWMMKLCG